MRSTRAAVVWLNWSAHVMVRPKVVVGVGPHAFQWWLTPIVERREVATLTLALVVAGHGLARQKNKA